MSEQKVGGTWLSRLQAAVRAEDRRHLAPPPPSCRQSRDHGGVGPSRPAMRFVAFGGRDPSLWGCSPARCTASRRDRLRIRAGPGGALCPARTCAMSPSSTVRTCTSAAQRPEQQFLVGSQHGDGQQDVRLGRSHSPQYFSTSGPARRGAPRRSSQPARAPGHRRRIRRSRRAPSRGRSRIRCHTPGTAAWRLRWSDRFLSGFSVPSDELVSCGVLHDVGRVRPARRRATPRRRPAW